MLFVPLVILALGLLFRGERGWRHVLLMSVGLVGVAAAHSTSAVVVSAVLVAAPLVDVLARLVAGPERSARCRARLVERRDRAAAAVRGGDCVRAWGRGVIGHLWLQGRALGRPVSYRFLGPDWLDRASLEGYYGLPFLVVTPRRRGARAHVSTAASRPCPARPRVARARVRRRRPTLAGARLVRLPARRLLLRRRARAPDRGGVHAPKAPRRLDCGLRPRVRPRRTDRRWGFAFQSASCSPSRALRRSPVSPRSGRSSTRGVLPDSERIVTDACLHFAVPYLVRRPTLPAFTERQVGFVDRLPLARQAAAVLAGGPEGAALAARLGVGYAVADPDVRARSRVEARRDDGRRERGPGRHSAAAGALRLTPRACRASAAGARSAERRASAADGRAGGRAGGRRTSRARRRPCTGSSGGDRSATATRAPPARSATLRGAARPSTRPPRRTSAPPRRPSRRTGGRRCAMVYAWECRTTARGS